MNEGAIIDRIISDADACVAVWVDVGGHDPNESSGVKFMSVNELVSGHIFLTATYSNFRAKTWDPPID